MEEDSLLEYSTMVKIKILHSTHTLKLMLKYETSSLSFLTQNLEKFYQKEISQWYLMNLSLHSQKIECFIMTLDIIRQMINGIRQIAIEL